MRVIDSILLPSNIQKAIDSVMENKGSAGVDQKTVEELPEYWMENGAQISESIRKMRYKPMPVKRVYIPKPNGKKRPLGIPTVCDRMIQRATEQVLETIFEPEFSTSSFGFRSGVSAHDAVFQALNYLNEGYQWVVDLDIEKFFDRVNHDKLISIIRTKVNEREVLHLIRSFLKAGIMEDGKVTTNDLGTPQGGTISPLLANIYLDQFDKELESRGLRFCRFADDVVIFTKSEMAANRVMKSVSSWLERKLFLKVSPTKTHVCRPNDSTFLGFSFWSNKGHWQAKPADDRKQRLRDKVKKILIRKRAGATNLADVFTKINQVVRGWINYFCIGDMKKFMDEFGKWLRHKVRVIILKQWKRPRTIYRNLQILKRFLNSNIDDETIRQTANSRLGLYRSAGKKTMNFLIPLKVLESPQGDRPGLINPLKAYLQIRESKFA